MADQKKNIDLFNNGLVNLLKEEWQPDVWLLTGDDDDHEEPIPAHKIILAARSDYLKDICDDDHNYEEPIIIYDMNHEALEVFIEFMYVGNSISSEKLRKHARSLYRAADTYGIPLLRELCKYQLMCSLNMSNALDIYELSKDNRQEKTLHERVRCYVVHHLEVIAFTNKFESFVERNPSLTVELFRELLMFQAERRRT